MLMLARSSPHGGGWYLAALLALGLPGCADSVGGDGTPVAQLAVKPVFPTAMASGYFNLDVDRVRIRMTRPPSEPVLDTTVVFPVDSDQLTVQLRVPLLSRREQLVVALELRSGQRLLFSGSREIEVTDQAATAPEIPLQYVGPGQQVNQLRIEPRDSVLKPGDTFAFRIFGFQNGAEVPEFYVGWASGEPSVADIDATGSIRAPGTRSSVIVRAITPTGIKDSTRLWFAPPPAAMTMVGGNNQVGQAGSSLGALLAVRLIATDGIGVPGVRVRFIPLGGGRVRDTLAISDIDGVARTVATLGPIAGPQPFEAVVPFQPPIIFDALAVAGPPTEVHQLSGNGQSGVVGSLLNRPFVTSVTDVYGNPAAGVPVVWSVVSGGGTLEQVGTLTDASGLASALLRLGGTPGNNTVRARVGPPPLQVDFSATGTLGVADSIVAISGDSATASPNTTLPPFVVKVTDHFGNPMPLVQVSWEILLGDGHLSASTSVSNGAGLASISYTLGSTLGVHRIRARIPAGDFHVFIATAAP